MAYKIDFGKWINESFSPCCYVYSTESAKNIIRKNNLSPSEFLRPFGDFTGQQVVTSFGDKGKSTSNFRLDFYDSENCNSIRPESYHDYVATLFSNGTICPQEIHFTKENFKYIYNKIQSTSNQWIREFESTFIECLRFNEYEYFQHPICNIYFCSINDDLNCIDLLCSKKQLPRLIKDGLYENPTSGVIIILNDRDVNYSKKDTGYVTYKNKYSTFIVMVWEINRQGQDSSDSANTYDIWSPYFHKVDLYNPASPYQPQMYGHHISKNEIKEYRETFKQLLNDYILKNLKETVAKIETQYSESKSYMKWFDKSDTKADYIDSFKLYKLKDIDQKRYYLGMIYFYFNYYEEALTIFNKLKSDIKSKDFSFYSASLYQMCVLSQFLSMNGKPIDLDQAYRHYHKNNQYAQALRALFIQIHMYEYLDKDEQLPQLIKTARDSIPVIVFNTLTSSEKDDVKNYLTPILYEKESLYCFLAKRQPRKFFLNMIYAGKTYANLKKDKMAYYAMNSFGLLYQFLNNVSPSFVRLKDYLNCQMGELCNKIDYPEGYRFYRNCIELSKYLPNSNNQADYMKLYLYTLDKAKENTNRLGAIDTSSFHVPEIDNSTVLIVEEQDFKITKISQDQDVFKTHHWSYFNKYSEINKKKIFSNLLENDMIIIKLLDKMTDERESCSNFYSRRNFRGNVKQKVYVRFQISNPLNTKINITSLKLFCDFIAETPKEAAVTEKSTSNSSLTAMFKKDIEFQVIKLELEKKSSKVVEVYFRPHVAGQCIVKGVDMVLSNVAEIKHYFNQKNVSRLYYYRAHHSGSTNELGRRSSVSSSSQSQNLNQSHSDSSSSHKKTLFNHKVDIMYDAVSEDSDIVINFPKGKEITIYQNELLLIPIQIKNNSAYKIKRFSVFMANTQRETSKPQAVYCENIYRVINLYGETTSTEVIAPFIPITSGKMYIKVLIKFEDELKFKVIDIRRYLFIINVLPSINVGIKEEIVQLDTNPQLDKVINFNLHTQVCIENRQCLSQLTIGAIFHNDNYRTQEYSDWRVISNESYDKYYNCIPLMNVKKYVNNFPNKDRRYSIKPEKKVVIIDGLSNDIMESQPHILRKIYTLLNTETLIFNWSAKDNKDKMIHGLFFHQTQLSIPKTNAQFLKTIVSNAIHINSTQYSLNAEDTMVNIDIEFNKQIMLEIKDVENYEFIVNDNDPVLLWVGLKAYHILNEPIITGNKEVKLQFAFVTKVKGDITMKQISMNVYLKKKDKKHPIQLKEIPYPLLITIQ